MQKYLGKCYCRKDFFTSDGKIIYKKGELYNYLSTHYDGEYVVINHDKDLLVTDYYYFNFSFQSAYYFPEYFFTQNQYRKAKLYKIMKKCELQ